MDIISSNNERAQSLYISLIEQLVGDCSGFSILIIQHVVPNSLPLFKALRSKFDLVGIIPKRRSTNSATISQLESADPPFPILNGTREQLCDEAYLNERVRPKLGDNKLIILDIGGYFSESITILKEVFNEQIAGIIEDTENGHQKYEEFFGYEPQEERRTPFPILSVARSPLKEPEDHLVGQSVLYSLENSLRGHSTLLTNKIVLVIGYGKIGKSVANSLAVRNVTVWIYDHDPMRSAQALAHGFYVPERSFGITTADIIVGATGNNSLVENDFYQLKNCSFVCSVTSADDEFDFGSLRKNLPFRDTEANGEVFAVNDEKIFHLLNRGNAINFLHGAVLGTYIYLVACELIGCIAKVIKGIEENELSSIIELTKPERRLIADAWVTEFKKNATA